MESYAFYALDEEGRILAMEPRHSASASDVIRQAEAQLATCARVEVWGPAGCVYQATRQQPPGHA